MKRMIATTTINPPTEAIRRFDALADWELIVAVDRKTPADYSLARGTVLSIDMQEAMDSELSQAIGWNCIERRNMAILAAYERGADIVAVVDDDNIPEPWWGKDLLLGKPARVRYFETGLPVFDPVGATNYPHLWHRGFPLELLTKRDYRNESVRTVVADVQADFWNGDPDIDAVCRMEHAPDCTFEPRCFPIASNRPSPFNSQNTFLARHVVKDYFLAPDVGRSQDIWASFFVQAKGHQVVYGAPSVKQVRNPHDPLLDFAGELPGYQLNSRLVAALMEDPGRLAGFLTPRAVRAFELYQRHFRGR